MSKPIPRRHVAFVIDRDEGVCQLNLKGCLGEASCADHITNRGAGGAPILNDPRCLVAACGLCNGRKTTVHGEERAALEARNLILPPHATHAKTFARVVSTPHQDPAGRWWLRIETGRVEVDAPDG